MAKRVFIVEDHEAVRETYALFLDLEDDLAVCGAAATAEEAMELLSSAAPDLLLLDVSLPGMSGIELLERLRKDGSQIPVVILTGHDNSVYREGARRAGAEAFVIKQDGPAVVLETIQRVLRPKTG